MTVANERERMEATRECAATSATVSRPARRVVTVAAAAPAVPGFLVAAFGGLAGLAGASLVLVPILMLGVVRGIAGGEGPSGEKVAASGGGGAATGPASVVTAVAASAAPSAAELRALRMLTPGDADQGEQHFATYCAACHGPDGKGRPNLGKDLVSSGFVKGQSDAQLIVFIKKGRDVSDPLNTSKVPMPPKGGNPAFTDGELNDLVAYVRHLQKKG
jgi:mono/diheme cytochrome c family protein